MAVHLRCHSEYSISHGMIRLTGENELGLIAKERGISTVALTDSNNVHGAVAHYKSCQRHGIKPILGCHANFAFENQNFSVTLLCENETGFDNLSSLLTAAQLHNNGYIDFANLTADELKGLFVCFGYESNIAAALTSNNTKKAKAHFDAWAKLCEDEHLICALSFANRRNEKDITPWLAKLATENGIATIATHPALFANAKDFEHHEIRVCIANAWQLESKTRPKPYTKDQYFWSDKELKNKFAKWQGCIDNAEEIARRCNFDFKLKKSSQFPKFLVNNEVVTDTQGLLREQAQQGLAELGLDDSKVQQYEDRLKIELDVICSKGFADYFLIVAEMVKFAKESGIPVGPGRGSGAGSLVAYVLKITTVDPLEYDLLFERFLNPERTELPDFDIDFCKRRRNEIFAHARDQYGKDCVAQVATFGSLKAKAVVRDVCRVLSLPYSMGDTMARLIPETLNITLGEARKESLELNKYIKSEKVLERVWNHSLALEGLPRQVSTHAAAILIAPKPITEFSPLALIAGKNNSEPVCQYDKDAAEAVGLIKFDILGLKNLTMLKHAEHLIKQHHKKFSLEKIPLTDKKTYQLYQVGKTIGVFQCESTGMIALMKQIAPQQIEDIALTISLFRPGVLSNNMHKTYLNHRKNKEQIHYPHKLAEPVLEPTYGVMIYQEQVMRLSQVLADFSLAKADQLRAAIGKKNVQAMSKLKHDFIEQSSTKIGEQAARKLFNEIQEFAGYGFNKSHAIAYALLSYQTAYCKANYRTEFFASALSVWQDDPKTQAQLLDDAKVQKIKVLSPCINNPSAEFSVVDETTIRFGLGSVRGIGSVVANEIVRVHDEDGKFTSLDNFCERMPRELVNRRLLEGLILAGACDCLNEDANITANQFRPQLHASAQFSMEHAAYVKQHENQENLFGGAVEEKTTESKITFDPTIKPQSLIEQLIAEEEVLGKPLTKDYFDVYQHFLRKEKISPLADDENLAGKHLWAGHVVRHITNHRIRDQKRLVFILSDGTATVEVNAKPHMAEGIDFDARGLVVFVEGIFENTFNGMRVLTASNIYDIDKWCARHTKITLDISSEKDKFNELLNYLENLKKDYAASDGPDFHLRLHDDEISGEIDLGIKLALPAQHLIAIEDQTGAKTFFQ